MQGTLTTQQNIYLSGTGSKIGVGVAVAESSIHTMNLKATTPTTMGIHLGMDTVTGAAGIEIVAASTTQKRLHRFYIPWCSKQREDFIQ